MHKHCTYCMFDLTLKDATFKEKKVLQLQGIAIIHININIIIVI